MSGNCTCKQVFLGDLYLSYGQLFPISLLIQPVPHHFIQSFSDVSYSGMFKIHINLLGKNYDTFCFTLDSTISWVDILYFFIPLYCQYKWITRLFSCTVSLTVQFNTIQDEWLWPVILRSLPLFPVGCQLLLPTDKHTRKAKERTIFTEVLSLFVCSLTLKLVATELSSLLLPKCLFPASCCDGSCHGPLL